MYHKKLQKEREEDIIEINGEERLRVLWTVFIVCVLETNFSFQQLMDR